MTFLINSYRFGAGVDPNAAAYIAAVEAADGQALEAAIKTAINDWYVEIKADGYFSSIKQAGLFCGARTIPGAMQALAGALSINNGFTTSSYNRKTGFTGTNNKFINPNRLSSDDPQNDHHMVFYFTGSGSGTMISSYDGTAGEYSEFIGYLSGFVSASRQNGGTALTSSITRAPGFVGLSRSSAGSYQFRNAGTQITVTASSIAPRALPYRVMLRPTDLLPLSGQGLFYSIGTSLDLALYEARVTALISAIQAALP